MTATPLDYKRLFNAAAAPEPVESASQERVGDQFTGGRYVYDEDDEASAGRIELAVNVALAAGRPLLVRGVPGTGKSSLAADVAARLRWRYYEHVVSSRTQARDLLWTFDSVKRLSDAQAAGARRGDGVAAVELKPDTAYVTPGVLWWAFNRESALRLAADPAVPPRDSEGAVVLIDEIDKADPDVPNDLLVPLGSFRFTVHLASDHEIPVEAKQAPLVVITTNEERDLPQAFLRRCVTLVLEPPGDSRLRRIARAHYPDDPDGPTLDKILEQYRAVQARRRESGARRASIAEFLDAVAACRRLGSKPGDGRLWDTVVQLTMDKPDDPALTG